VENNHLLDFIEQNQTFTLTVEKVIINKIMLQSTSTEVIALFLWMLARLTEDNYDITFNKSPEPIRDVIRQQLISQIHIYYHHTDKRIRELAKIILTNIGDTKFLSTFGDIEKWINSLPILEKRKLHIINTFIAEEIYLHQLLDPTLSLELAILPIIQNLKFTSGCVLEIISSIGKLRNENQIAQKEITEIINVLLAKDRQNIDQLISAINQS